MALGTEMLIKAAISAIGLNPEVVAEQIVQVVQIAQTMDARVANIERTNLRILELLEGATADMIEAPSTEIQELANGQEIEH